MNLKPILCPNCGAAIKLTRIDELAACNHCDSSFFVEWPDDDDADHDPQADPLPAERRHFYVVLGANPFASCPFCTTQTLRTAANQNQEVVCSHCQQTAVMPPLTSQAARVCRRCGRAHFNDRCPDCSRNQVEFDFL